MFHPEGPTVAELIHQALSSTRRGYDLLAPKFDVTPFRTPEEILSGLASYLSELEGRLDIQQALDLCCGTGVVVEVVRPFCRAHAVGLDFSRAMLEVARHRVEGSGAIDGIPLCPVNLVQADALALPFAHGFDLITCFSALGHIPVAEQKKFLAQLHACLRPGGVFLFATAERPGYWSKPYWISTGFNVAMKLRNLLWTPPFIMFYLTFLVPEVIALLEESGFDVELERGRFAEPFREFLLLAARRR